MEEEEELLTFQCPLCGKIGIESEILPHIDDCDGSGETRIRKPTIKDAKYFLVLKDYQAKDQIELNLEEGDIIKFSAKVDDEWMKGELNGEIGLFKLSHVEPTNQEPTRVNEFLQKNPNIERKENFKVNRPQSHIFVSPPTPRLARSDLASTSLTNVSLQINNPRRGTANAQKTQSLLDMNNLIKAEKVMDAYLISKGDEAKFMGRFKHTVLKKKGAVKGEVKLVEDMKEVIFVVGKHRFYTFKPDSGKAKDDAHILDVQEISSPSKSEVTVKYGTNDLAYEVKFQAIGDEGIMDIADSLHECFLTNFPNWKCFPINIDGRTLKEKKIENGPCDGYSAVYKALCDYYSIPCVGELYWDIDNLFEKNNTKQLTLTEFDIPKNSSGRAIIEALRFNHWFEELNVTLGSHLKLSGDPVSSIARMLKDNTTLRTIIMSGYNLSTPFLSIGRLMSANQSITRLDFSYCKIEDKGIISLANEYFNEITSLKYLNLAGIEAEKKGMASLFKSFTQNTHLQENLIELNISHNTLGSEGSSELANFLEKSKSLKKLEMEHTSPSYSLLSKSISFKPVTCLNISNNKISKKEIQALGKFLGSMPQLQELDISTCSLDPRKWNQVKDLVGECSNLRSLNLSDNDLSAEGIFTLVRWLEGGVLKNLKEIKLDRVITKNINKVQLDQAINALCHLLSSEAVSIEYFSFAGSGTKENYQLGEKIINLVFELLTNETLLEMDISGHNAGNTLAITLGKVAQANTTIKRIVWDDNGINPFGLRKLKIGLERNSTIINMPLPYHDLNKILEQGDLPQIFDDILNGIQERISSNNAQEEIEDSE